MNFKAVIFDFNGTLFFDNDKHVLAWGKISRELRGHDITMDELMNKINGVPNKEVINYFCDGNLIIRNGVVIDDYSKDAGRYIIADNYVIDAREKTIYPFEYINFSFR